MASWVYWVAVSHSSWKPAACPEEVLPGVPVGFGTEFEVVCTTTEEELLRFWAPRQVLQWRFHQVFSILRVVLANLVQVSFEYCFTGPADAVPFFSGADGV